MSRPASIDELLMVRKLRAEGYGSDDIAAELPGRTGDDVRAWTRAGLPSVGEIPIARRHDGPTRGLGLGVGPIPSPSQLADRERRHSAPQSITAAHFGDPVPGRSALDQMKASGRWPA
ncbi:MAG: hypothetical protein AB7U62_19900 [Pseudolabrys sp.]